MSFRRELLARAAQRGARIVLCEGDDERVRTAAERLHAERIVEPIVLGRGAVEPAKDPRLNRIAQFLRERRPERIRDGVHALDVAAEPVNFGAALVAMGEADGCVAGAVYPTGEVVRAALWAIGTAPGVSLVSSAFYMVTAEDLVRAVEDLAGRVVERRTNTLVPAVWPTGVRRERRRESRDGLACC